VQHAAAHAARRACTPQVKILLQVSSVNTQSAAAKAAAKGGLVSTFMEIGRSEGIRGYWRGNIPQVRGGRAQRKLPPLRRLAAAHAHAAGVQLSAASRHAPGA
jgi:hypothetical protein